MEPTFLSFSKNRIMKVSYPNRRLFMQLSLVLSLIGSLLICIGTFTNSWLFSAERIKYCEANETTEPTVVASSNQSSSADSSAGEKSLVVPTTCFRNASFGPWIFCANDVEKGIPFECNPVSFFGAPVNASAAVAGDQSNKQEQEQEAGDSTGAVEIALRKTAFLLVGCTALTLLSSAMLILSNLKKNNNYRIVLLSAVLHIFSGMANFLTIVIYISGLTQEVGKKLFAPSPLDDPMFYYEYGFSFYCAISSFVFVQLAAVLALSVYMAKHDEDMYNRYHIRRMFDSNNRPDLMSDILNNIVPTRASRGRFRRHSSNFIEKSSSRGSSVSPSFEDQFLRPTTLSSFVLNGADQKLATLSPNRLDQFHYYGDGQNETARPTSPVMMPSSNRFLQVDAVYGQPSGTFSSNGGFSYSSANTYTKV